MANLKDTDKLIISRGNDSYSYTYTDLKASLDADGIGSTDASTTPPANPDIGDLWLDTNECPPELKVWTDCGGTAQWEGISGGGGDVTAPVIEKITLTELSPGGDRFSGQEFQTTVDFNNAGTPTANLYYAYSVIGTFGNTVTTSKITNYNAAGYLEFEDNTGFNTLSKGDLLFMQPHDPDFTVLGALDVYNTGYSTVTDPDTGQSVEQRQPLIAYTLPQYQSTYTQGWDLPYYIQTTILTDGTTFAQMGEGWRNQKYFYEDGVITYKSYQQHEWSPEYRGVNKYNDKGWGSDNGGYCSYPVIFPNKYNLATTTTNGIRFDSDGERSGWNVFSFSDYFITIDGNSTYFYFMEGNSTWTEATFNGNVSGWKWITYLSATEAILWYYGGSTKLTYSGASNIKAEAWNKIPNFNGVVSEQVHDDAEGGIVYVYTPQSDEQFAQYSMDKCETWKTFSTNGINGTAKFSSGCNVVYRNDTKTWYTLLGNAYESSTYYKLFWSTVDPENGPWVISNATTIYNSSNTRQALFFDINRKKLIIPYDDSSNYSYITEADDWIMGPSETNVRVNCNSEADRNTLYSKLKVGLTTHTSASNTYNKNVKTQAFIKSFTTYADTQLQLTLTPFFRPSDSTNFEYQSDDILFISPLEDQTRWVVDRVENNRVYGAWGAWYMPYSYSTWSADSWQMTSEFKTDIESEKGLYIDNNGEVQGLTNSATVYQSYLTSRNIEFPVNASTGQSWDTELPASTLR